MLIAIADPVGNNQVQANAAGPILDRIDASRVIPNLFFITATLLALTIAGASRSVAIGDDTAGSASAKNAQAAPLTPPTDADPIEITFKQDGFQYSGTAELLVEAADGGGLVRTPDGRLWLLQPEEIQSRKSVEGPMAVLTKDQMAAQLKKELPNDFETMITAHYVIAYNTSEAYAKWTASLLERLNRGFYGYWKSRGMPLNEPRFPLVVLVFDSPASYQVYAKRELGEAAADMYGYYSMTSNRITVYDLTGVELQGEQRRPVATSILINQILSRPQAERTVATMVHESVHQLAYNSGLQVRLADNPFWVSEGLAVFFEAPDVNSSQGWGTIGKVNTYNLVEFRKYLSQRPADSLLTLLSEDTRFRDPATARAAYGESWALNYFLLRSRPKDYVKYLQFLAEKPPLGPSNPRDRITEFQRFFGDDLQTLDNQFVRFIQRLR